jgi:Acetyltransferase (GNAT) domain
MNVFTTPAFLEIAGELFFPRRARSIELFRINGQVLRLLVLDGRHVVRTMPYYDFPQPLEGQFGTLPELAFFPRTVVRTTTVEARTEKEPPGYLPSPYIDWSAFADYAAYEAMVRARGTLRKEDAERKRRRLARELGEIRFEFDDPRPEVFDACIRWKSAQYLSTGLGDGFAVPAHVELFRRLRTAGVVAVSSLSAGNTLLAVHFGSHTDRRLGWWIPAYDPAHQRHSPGRMMMAELMRASQAMGDLEFDFLIGDEDYKFDFATHNRVIGPLGTRPWREQLVLEAQKQAKALLKRYPRAYELAREAKKRVDSQLHRLRF